MTAITDPSRLSALLKYFKSFSILRDIWHIKGLKRESEISGETLRSTIRTSQQPNPKSGPKNLIKPRSAVVIGSADPLKFRSESRIRAKISTKSADP